MRCRDPLLHALPLAALATPRPPAPPGKSLSQSPRAWPTSLAVSVPWLPCLPSREACSGETHQGRREPCVSGEQLSAETVATRVSRGRLQVIGATHNQAEVTREAHAWEVAHVYLGGRIYVYKR
eukprot:1084582-Rhodomonas_salina.4